MSYPKLRGAIREKFGTQKAFAEALGINSSTLVNKLSGRVEWTVSEVQASVEFLDIPWEHIRDYFFTQ